MNEPRKYRKKPVVIQAVHWDGTATHAVDVIEWILNSGGAAVYVCDEGACTGESAGHKIEIRTLEGTMTADHGDWIIRGIQDEFYPCRGDIFKMTYEVVVDET